MIVLNPKTNVIFEHLQPEELRFQVIAKSLSSVACYYPNFKNWLYFTFRKEMIEGKRSIIIARNGNSLAGLSLLKHSSSEKKICTFYITPDFRDAGIGHQLLNQSISYLGEEDIKITVAQERNSELYPLLKSKGFSLEKKIGGYYRNNIDEYFYSI